MFPRIKKVEQGKIHINEDIVTDNFFIHPNGHELLEKRPSATNKELEKMLLHEPEAVIFGIGFRGKATVAPEVMNATAKLKVNVHVLNTPEALKKFQEIARQGRKVVAHINVGE